MNPSPGRGVVSPDSLLVADLSAPLPEPKGVVAGRVVRRSRKTERVWVDLSGRG